MERGSEDPRLQTFQALRGSDEARVANQSDRAETPLSSPRICYEEPMSDTPTQKTAFQSLTLRSIAAIAIGIAAGRFGVALPEGAAQQLAGAVMDLVVTLGCIGVAVGRTRASTPIR
jgi:hypothetical protein